MGNSLYVDIVIISVFGHIRRYKGHDCVFVFVCYCNIQILIKLYNKQVAVRVRPLRSEDGARIVHVVNDKVNMSQPSIEHLVL